jgi:hypothetical protein
LEEVRSLVEENGPPDAVLMSYWVLAILPPVESQAAFIA